MQDILSWKDPTKTIEFNSRLHTGHPKFMYKSTVQMLVELWQLVAIPTALGSPFQGLTTLWWRTFFLTPTWPFPDAAPRHSLCHCHQRAAISPSTPLVRIYRLLWGIPSVPSSLESKVKIFTEVLHVVISNCPKRSCLFTSFSFLTCSLHISLRNCNHHSSF